eukprot:g15504.t1
MAADLFAGFASRVLRCLGLGGIRRKNPAARGVAASGLCERIKAKPERLKSLEEKERAERQMAGGGGKKEKAEAGRLGVIPRRLLTKKTTKRVAEKFKKEWDYVGEGLTMWANNDEPPPGRVKLLASLVLEKTSRPRAGGGRLWFSHLQKSKTSRAGSDQSRRLVAMLQVVRPVG